jgi:hypothetical protein
MEADVLLRFTSMRITPFLAGAAAACCGVFFSTHAQVYTVDPAALINDYISIGEFNTTGNADGWGRSASAIAPFKVANGELEVTTTGGDPWFYRVNFATALGVPPDFTFVQVRIKFLSGAQDGWEMFWGSTTRGGPVGGQQIGYTLGLTDNEYHVIEFDLTEQLADGASLDDFRIDPGQGAGNKFLIDYVRVGKLSLDSDNDGLPDTVETATGVFVSARDTGTDPNQADTDGDGVSDGIEVQYGTDPNNKAEFPVPSIDKYSLNPAEYIVDVAIDPNIPTTSNGTVTGFQVAPALPNGLTLNPTTGQITGTPLAASPATDYTITATFTGGKSDTEVVNIAVRTPYFDYTLAKYTFRANIATADILPNIHGVAPTSFDVTPALPDGLAFDPTSGMLSGAGTGYSAPKDYTFVATYAAFPKYTNLVTISVVEDPVLTIDPEAKVLDYFSLGEFDDPADAAGWFANGIQTPFDVLDGALVVITTGGDPFFGKNPTLPADYRVIEFSMKVVDGSAAPTGIYWSENAPNRGYSEATHYQFPQLVEDGEFHVYQVDYRKSLDGMFNGIRIDPSGGAGLTAHFGYIRIGDFLPRLKIERPDDVTMRILWPAAATGFKLQSAATLPGTWTDSSHPVVVENDMNVVTVPTTNAALRFYRLIQ